MHNRLLQCQLARSESFQSLFFEVADSIKGYLGVVSKGKPSGSLR